MKGYQKPKQPLVNGLCCLCGKPCGDGHYLHWECALSYSAVKDKAIQEAKQGVIDNHGRSEIVALKPKEKELEVLQ